MAEAGDGKQRSEKRKAAHVIAFRVTAEQLHQVKRNTNKWGYESHTEFARDVALRQNAIPQRTLAQVRARLVRIYNTLENLRRRPEDENKASNAKIKAIQAEIKTVFEAISGVTRR